MNEFFDIMVNLSKMFAKAGRQTKYKKPYDLPNIVLWNVGKHEKEVCFGFVAAIFVFVIVSFVLSYHHLIF